MDTRGDGHLLSESGGNKRSASAALERGADGDVEGKGPKKHQKRHDWIVMYEALVRFGNEHGHCNVPLRYQKVKVNETDSAHLGAWLATQRREHLNGKMKPERLVLMQKLVDSNMLEWSPLNHSKQSEQTWPLMYECLKMYCRERQSENPGSEVSSIPENRKWKHPDGWEVGLGRWMHTQNKQRRAGKLRADRCAKMEELVKAGMFRWPTQRVSKNHTGGKPIVNGSSSSSSGAASSSSSSTSIPSSSSSSGGINGAKTNKGEIVMRDYYQNGPAGVLTSSKKRGAPEKQVTFDRTNEVYGLRTAPTKTGPYDVVTHTGPTRRGRGGTSSSSAPRRGHVSSTSSSGTIALANAMVSRGISGPTIGSNAYLGPLYSLAVPAAGMQYARDLTARYLLKAARSRNEDKIDLVFPIPSIQRASDSNQPPPMHPPGSAPPVFETSPDGMLPVPIEIDLTSTELTRAIKNQLKAHVLATLAVDARRGSGDEATVKEDIKNLAMAALMVEKEEREDEEQDGNVNAKAGTLEGGEKDQSEEMDEEVDKASVKAKKKSNVTKE